MTHERTAGASEVGGPERDDTLPDAASIPVAEGPDELAPTEWPDEWETSTWL